MAIEALDVSHRYPHPQPVRHTLGDKLQFIAARSPKDLKAIEVIVDLVVTRLHAEDPPR